MRVVGSVMMVFLALVGPASAQAPNIGQLLQGLTTGNQNQDQALRDAFERGYQRGRQDEARNNQNTNRRAPDRRDDGYSRDDRGPDRNDNGQGGSYRR